MAIAMTKKELANLAGYTYRRLYDIDRNLPQEKKLFVESEGGKYDLATFVQRWVKCNVDNETSEEDDLDYVKAKHEIVKTRKTQLEVDRMSGQLIALNDLKRLWGGIANAVKHNLLNLPNKVAPRLRMLESPEIIASIINDEIYLALEAIANTPLPDYAAEDNNSEEAQEDDEEA